MAHDWYIKRGEKTYGPLTSAQLKKAASEGKVLPTTELRLGADGSWSPASRVKGLFAPSQDASNSATLSASSFAASPRPPVPPPPVTKIPPQPPVASPLAAAPPLAATPLVARPMTATPLASAVVPPAADPPIAGKLIGAIGLTFGVLALGTCWLSLVESLFGWVGIAVGSLGLVIGIAGLVVAALQNASGLVLNVAAASSALVGLVASVVLGIQSGMFSKPEPPAVVVPPIIVQSPPPPAPKVEEPEPPPERIVPPEPVWTDASQSIEQGPIRAQITAAAVEQLRLESANPLSMAREKAAPYLHVRVRLENISTDKIVSAPGWMGAGASSGALGVVGQALGESDIGKQFAGATAAAILIDDKLNPYPQVEAIRLPASHELGGNPSLRPGESSEKHMLFDRPLDGAQYLRIELAPGGFGGTEPLRFQIPRSMWTGEEPMGTPPAEAPATDSPATDSPTSASDEPS